MLINLMPVSVRICIIVGRFDMVGGSYRGRREPTQYGNGRYNAKMERAPKFPFFPKSTSLVCKESKRLFQS